jgi:hypothetical protein
MVREQSVKIVHRNTRIFHDACGQLIVFGDDVVD